MESNEVSGVATTQAVTETTSSWDPYERGCPSRGLLDRIGDKWTVLVLGELGKHGACRFTHLRKGLSGVSEKMLTQTLRALERDGLVHRTVYPTLRHARKDIARWIELRYNQSRLHSTLGYRTPREVMDELLGMETAA